MKELTQEQFECIQNGWAFNCDGRQNWKYEVIDKIHVKHDITHYDFVFQEPNTEKWYQGGYSNSYNYGIPDYTFPIELDEVELIEVTVIKWRKVK